MTLSTKIELLLILHLLAVGLHTCTAVARSLCVSWAFLLDMALEISQVTSLCHDESTMMMIFGFFVVL